MLLRDRLRARLAEMGNAPDHQRLVLEVLGIQHASPELARRLVAQALVVEDRQEAWRRAGETICANAPQAPGVYVMRDEHGAAVYVGKAVNLRRRLRAHFATRRWPALKAGMARIVTAEWQLVGSELEALVREASLIAELRPTVNVQTGAPDLKTRAIPRSLLRDVVVIVPSAETGAVEVIAARVDGGWSIERVRRDGASVVDVATRVRKFFRRRRRSSTDGVEPRIAPIVFSWLAGRGHHASRLDPHDTRTSGELAARLAALLGDEGLFEERLDQRVINSKFRSSSTRP